MFGEDELEKVNEERDVVITIDGEFKCSGHM